MSRQIFNLCFFTLVFCGLGDVADTQAASELKTEPGKYLSDESLPPRTVPLLEVGPSFLGTGNIPKGFTLATGAVWTPSLWVYGNFRSGLQSYDEGGDLGVTTNEWANRLDLFANLQLSGTERILIGLTPLHNRDNGVFSGAVDHSGGDDETVNEFNLDLDTFFFEGDLAELFPNWDYLDSTKNDIGFTIGRQNIEFMDGFLINDNVDGIGFSKNNIRFTRNPNIINWRSSVFFGLNGVNRDDNLEDSDSILYAWFNQIDTISSTYNVDLAYVSSDLTGDLFNLGVDAIRRFGKTNATVRVAISQATGDTTVQSDDGVLLFSEFSWVPAYTHDNVYLNGFVAIDNFTSVARGPLAGGPLGRTGLLFAAQGLGSAPSALSNNATEAAGLAFGYQKFSKDRKTQITFEAAARYDSLDESETEYGLGVRFQRAIGHRSFWQLDGFATNSSISSGTEYAVRLELQIKL